MEKAVKILIFFSFFIKTFFLNELSLRSFVSISHKHYLNPSKINIFFSIVTRVHNKNGFYL